MPNCTCTTSNYHVWKLPSSLLEDSVYYKVVICLTGLNSLICRSNIRWGLWRHFVLRHSIMGITD